MLIAEFQTLPFLKAGSMYSLMAVDSTEDVLYICPRISSKDNR